MKIAAEMAAWDAKLKALHPIYSPMDEGDLIERADALADDKKIYGCCTKPPEPKNKSATSK